MAKNFTFNLSHIILLAIAMLYLSISLACDIVAYKMVAVGTLISIGAAFIFPLLYVLSDVMTEVFGEINAKIIIWIHVACDFIFTALILIIIHLPSPTMWHKQIAYNTVLDPMLRLYVANIIGVLISSLVNIHILSKWKILMGGRFFWIRSIGSTSIGVLIYTFVTDILAFHTTLNTPNLIEMTINNTVSNIALAAFYACFAAYFVKLLKNKLQIDSYEISAFNPFKF